MSRAYNLQYTLSLGGHKSHTTRTAADKKKKKGEIMQYHSLDYPALKEPQKHLLPPPLPSDMKKKNLKCEDVKGKSNLPVLFQTLFLCVCV